MINEPVVFAACSDIAGQVRGKAFPATELDSRAMKGVGWVPTNVQLTCFNAIAPSPYSSIGDLLLVPDMSTDVSLSLGDGAPADRFVLGDICTLEGAAWNLCTRSILKRALDEFYKETGLSVNAAFEHEFYYDAADDQQWTAFGLGTFRRHRTFAEGVVGALRQANLDPDSILAEYGNSQFEVTVAPKEGVRAADECIIAREAVRAVASHLGGRVSFSPMVKEGVGNGLHVHLSFKDRDGKPATYDPSGVFGMSKQAEQFFAGVRTLMPSMIALTAASEISYERLKPNRWSAAYNNIAANDREAALRICPITNVNGGNPSSQFNVEFRAADAAASPYIQLAAIVRAGTVGIQNKLKVDPKEHGDLSSLSADQLASLNIRRLPESLDEALIEFERTPGLSDWFGEEFVDVYTTHKRAELEFIVEMDEAEKRRLYSLVY